MVLLNKVVLLLTVLTIQTVERQVRISLPVKIKKTLGTEMNLLTAVGNH